MNASRNQNGNDEDGADQNGGVISHICNHCKLGTPIRGFFLGRNLTMDTEEQDRKRAYYLGMTLTDFLKRKAELLKQAETLNEAELNETTTA